MGWGPPIASCRRTYRTHATVIMTDCYVVCINLSFVVVPHRNKMGPRCELVRVSVVSFFRVSVCVCVFLYFSSGTTATPNWTGSSTLILVRKFSFCTCCVSCSWGFFWVVFEFFQSSMSFLRKKWQTTKQMCEKARESARDVWKGTIRVRGFMAI